MKTDTEKAFKKLDAEMQEIIRNGGHSTTWDHHIGQVKAKKILRRAAASAKLRDTMMPHVLLASPRAGIGKTSLAILVALELGRPFRIVSGKITLREMRRILADMSNHDVLIIDECHLLVQGGKANSEWLLPYMQSGKLIGPAGPEDFPRVTIIGTTTNAGALPGPIRERFVYTPPLEAYTDEEAAQIAFLHCGNLLPAGVAVPTIEVAMRLARAACNRPRVIRSLVMTMLDLAVLGEIEGPEYDLSEVFETLEITHDGLDAKMQAYLQLLSSTVDPVGKEVLSEHLGEKGEGLFAIESTLMEKGLIARTRGGRELTREGIVRTKALASE